MMMVYAILRMKVDNFLTHQHPVANELELKCVLQPKAQIRKQAPTCHIISLVDPS
jgi:hypothetical protein